MIGVGFVGVADSGSKALLWDTRTGETRGIRCHMPAQPSRRIFSPDGHYFVTGDLEGTRLWERATGTPIGERLGGGHTAPAAFFPDGKRVLVVKDGVAHIWDVASGSLTGLPQLHREGGILRAVLAPGGRSILIAGRDHVARSWDMATGKPIGPPVILDGSVLIATSADGRTSAAAGPGGRVAVWNPPAPLAGNVEDIRLSIERLTGMELDSRGSVTPLSPAALTSPAANRRNGKAF